MQFPMPPSLHELAPAEGRLVRKTAVYPLCEPGGAATSFALELTSRGSMHLTQTIETVRRVATGTFDIKLRRRTLLTLPLPPANSGWLSRMRRQVGGLVIPDGADLWTVFLEQIVKLDRPTACARGTLDDLRAIIEAALIVVPAWLENERPDGLGPFPRLFNAWLHHVPGGAARFVTLRTRTYQSFDRACPLFRVLDAALRYFGPGGLSLKTSPSGGFLFERASLEFIGMTVPSGHERMAAMETLTDKWAGYPGLPPLDALLRPRSTGQAEMHQADDMPRGAAKDS